MGHAAGAAPGISGAAPGISGTAPGISETGGGGVEHAAGAALGVYRGAGAGGEVWDMQDNRRIRGSNIS